MVISDAIDQSHCEHVAHQGTAAIADKRERNTSDWKYLDRHADVLKDMKCNHTDNTNANICIEGDIRFQ